MQLDLVSRDPWRLRLNLLPSEPVTLRSGTQRGAPGENSHRTLLTIQAGYCLCRDTERSGMLPPCAGCIPA